MFHLPKGKPEFSKLEESILQYWKENKTFEKSVESRPAENPYRFYDGPPFITGTPHYGTLMSSVIKDLIPRYQTMLGKRVERVWGWDCHGLPIEQKVQKKMGLESNKEIEESAGGIQGFIDECYNYTRDTSSEWGWYIDHIGRWVDMDNAYRTMDQNYMESVMWVFKQIWEKGYIYEGKRVSWYSWKLSTPISNFEIAMDDSYQDVQDPAITVKFPILDAQKIHASFPVSFLAWTTTPWTIPMHMALAVNNDITYAQVLSYDEVYILAQSRVETVFKGKGDYQVIGTMSGSELVGLHYQPPFDFYAQKIDEKNFRVYHADFVTDTDGTGIAHEAPEFGDVDFQLAKAEGINITSAIDEAGKYTAQIPDYQGQLYLDCIEPITERLKLEGKLFKKESITHRVPYCPRSNTPLIQKAQKSWFIDIQRIKSELIAQNENINWFPDHFKHGRFLKSLESAPDWCISRSRFWGTPMPVWQNTDGSERVVIDSREELYQRNKPLGQITKIIFVRHGESLKNTLGITDGTDKPRLPLTEKGKEDAQKTADALKSEKIDIIFSSPFARTQETAEIINKNHNLTIQYEERLREVFRGKFDGQIKENRSDEYYADMDLYYADRTYKVGGGDSANDISERMLNFIKEVSQNNSSKTIVVVSHGDPIAIALDALMSKQYFGKNIPLPPTGEIVTLYLDNNTGKEINLHRPYIDRIYVPGKSSFTPKKVLGVHGYNHYGNVVDFFEKTKEALAQEGVLMDAPFFESGESVDYKNWEKVFDSLDVASYDTWVTHSMGAKMARQYIVSKKLSIPRLILVAPRYELSSRATMEKVEKEQLTHTFEELRNYVDEIIVIKSEDDPGAPYVSGKKVAEVTGGTLITVNGWGHFNVVYSQFITGIILHGAPLRRIPEVLDVWMDSASMPYAQVHYPFENQAKMEASFPADFIAEYTGQIRAWFYVMHAIGVMVKGSPAFKNVAVTGVINGTDGRKMSKSFGNYPDPRETIEKYGADAIRFYLMGGTLMKGEDMTFSEAGIQESIKRVLLPLWNSYTFFATYANIDNWEFTDYSTKKTHELDTWIISRLHTLIQDVRNSMDIYDLQKTCDAIMVFLDGLNNWYIRRNRRRFWRSELDADKKSAYETLHEVLVTMTKLLAPICPFITEHLYQHLMNTTDSVHLTDFPAVNKKLISLEVNQKMSDLQNLTNLGLAIRGREKLRVRQPLRAATITLELDESARETLAEELNVKEIHTVKDVSDHVTITYSPDAKKIGATERKQWMKTIIADAKAGKGTLTSEGTLELTVSEAPNGKVILAADEFEAVYTPKSGSTIAFAGSAGYVIGLDTTLDEALTFEGYARDMIRGIQDARKELGFQVTDRLQLSLTSDNEMLGKILATHQGMIEGETLTTIHQAEDADGKELEIDEAFVVTLILKK